MKKYIVVRQCKDKLQYKKTKCSDCWSNTKEGCWQFTKAGAEKIAEKYNSNVHPSQKNRIKYYIIEA